MSAVPASSFDPVKIGIVSVSDRASTGVYEDKGLPALKDWLARALKTLRESVELYQEHSDAAIDQIKRCAKVYGDVVVLDLRNEQVIQDALDKTPVPR